jgi:hypothetical protein
VVFFHHRFEDAPHLLLAALRRNLDRIPVIEHACADAIAGLQYAPGCQCRDFRRDH